jgi:hypothetical protein
VVAAVADAAKAATAAMVVATKHDRRFDILANSRLLYYAIAVRAHLATVVLSPFLLNCLRAAHFLACIPASRRFFFPSPSRLSPRQKSIPRGRNRAAP